jgi:hypothetical protein
MDAQSLYSWGFSIVGAAIRHSSIGLFSDVCCPLAGRRRGEGACDERWLTSGVDAIDTASSLADLGHESPTALLPSFLASTLGAIEGVADRLAGATRFAGGALADDPHRRPDTAVAG